VSSLIPFSYNAKQVRVINKNGETWFVAKDICEILELGDTSKAISRISPSMKDTNSIPTPGGNQEMLIISEAGLYKLVFTSRKPEAEEFTNWVASEILPSIRKHGMYAKDELLDNPDLIIEIVTALKKEREEKRLLQAENKLLSQENLTWTNRKLIEAIVKKYGASKGSGPLGFSEGWKEFKKELLYKHSINLNARMTNYLNSTGKKNVKTLDMIHDNELMECISTAVALCRHNKVDISDIINKFNKTA
jgi:prophage antirepressor-like protein